MRLALKILLCIAINVVIIKYLFLNTIDKYSGKSILVKQVYSKPGYKYWSREDGALYCKESDDLQKEQYKKISSYSDRKTNVVLFTNVSLLDCLDYINTIAIEFHKYGLEVAFLIETDFDKEKVFNPETKEINASYFTEKYKKAETANDWVDYIVFDNAMSFLTFNERRQAQVILRDIFRKPYLGFSFSKEFDLPSDATHPHRQDRLIEEFMPRDDDGDFIITEIQVPSFRRTFIFLANNEIDKIGVDGEFID